MTREEALAEKYVSRSELINKIYNDHEVQLKQRDEEIERLEDQLSSVHNIMYRNGYSDAIDCYDTFGNFNTKHKPNAKARSIVAMLFWEWRKHKRMCELSKFGSYLAVTHLNNATLTKIIFDKAYAILKDTK